MNRLIKTSKKILALFCLIFITQTSYAQISKGGVPISFSEVIPIDDTINIIQMPIVNIDSLHIADSLEETEGEIELKPFRFGYAIDVDLNLLNAGKLTILPNGDRVWRLKIFSTNAYSINLIYDSFWLPQDAQFFVYNEDRSMVLGAFTSDVSNNVSNQFATDLVQGSAIVLEYFEPSYATGANINIDKVIHGYINTFSDGYGTSGSCNIDINCSHGDDWCAEKRAVSLILVNDNTAWCTGCLINNVREDLTPYYLTAEHCIVGQNTNTMIFRFKYWNQGCGWGTPSNWVSIAGANLRANHSATDFALLELSSAPPAGDGIIYAGWDRTTSAATSATAIHHPRGDAMKISHDFNSLSSVSWYSGASNHWRAVFDQGIVQHGSSGSPLFNQNHKIVGQLHGNQYNQCDRRNNACHCSQTPIGEYGKFDISWFGGGSSSTRLKDWLDPDNTGTATLNATSPKIYLINRSHWGNEQFAALENLHIEGEVTTGHPIYGNTFCQTSGAPFTTEAGSVITFTSKTITINRGTEFKSGSEVTITAQNNISCSDNLVDGDYINKLCNSQVSALIKYPNHNGDNISDFDTEVSSMNKEITSLNTIADIILYPNPNSGSFSVAFNNTEQKTIQIVNVLGNLIYKKQTTESSINIKLPDAGKGFYFINVQSESIQYNAKVLIE